jgi:hypothetical protein
MWTLQFLAFRTALVLMVYHGPATGALVMVIITVHAAPHTTVIGRMRALVWPVFLALISPHALILPDSAHRA